MNLRDIVTLFKNHQIQYGLNGDSENQMQELYKWELVSKQNGHPDPNAVDFSKEINSLEFKNLCFSSQITAIRNFVKYEPEEYRKLFRALFDENTLLQERVEYFTESCKTLWDDKIKAKFTNHTSAMCDERLISCFLTFHNPQKYTFYKNDVYKNLCKLLGVKPRKAGLKLVHFYELLDQYVIPEIEKENELILSINDEIKNNGCIQSMPLTAQTVLWYYNRTLLKNTDTDKEDNKNDLVKYEMAADGDEYRIITNVSKHSYHTGIYHAKVIATDENGISSVIAEEEADASLVGGIISVNQEKSEIYYPISLGEYKFYNTVQSISFAVWSSDGGQDDLTWYDASFIEGEYRANFEVANHMKQGEYNVHAYAKMKDGSSRFITASCWFCRHYTTCW